MDSVKLFGTWSSRFSKRVEMALILKGVEYEYVEEDLKNKSDQLLKYNPIHKKIPLLLHNGKPIVESLIILEYIDETWPEPALLPTDPYGKAMARFWAKFLDEKCFRAIKNAALSTGEEEEKANEEVSEVLSFLENELEGKKFFGGDEIGIVDIVANVFAFWYGILEEVGCKELQWSKFPNLYRWIEEYMNCSVVKETLPPKDKLVKYLKAQVQAIRANQ